MGPTKKGPQALKEPVVLSQSRELVPVGSRHLSVHRNATRRDESGKRPTTSRALVLRNGKYGAMGTGEVAPFKLSGREKLELLAEDLIEMSKSAVSLPFRMEQCKTIAESQFNARLDAISDLQDPDLFCDIIKTEVKARTKKQYLRGKEIDPLSDRAHVANVVAACIHNTYMLACAWGIVYEMLNELDEGSEDKFIRNRLASDKDYRMRYLILADFVNILVNVAQAQFQILVTTTDHYQKYFQNVSGGDPNNPEIQFDFSQLKSVYRSFLDSIVIELCLPESPIPRRILYQILHEAVEEAPREAKRFPQTVWDAVGDLAIMLQLQEILEAPLRGPEGEEWKKEPRHTPEEYEAWQDAQLLSERALQATANFRDIIFPIEKTRKLDTLQKMWQIINANCFATSGEYIDALWGLDGALNRVPRWRGINITKDVAKGSQPGGRLAITEGYESDDSMPSLESVSDSDEEYSGYDLDSDDYESDDEDDEYEYDSEDEEQMRELVREAMDTAIDIDLLNSRAPAPAMESIPDDRKDNPFLKLMTALRGRMFSSEPKLKTTNKETPRGGYASTAPAKDAYVKDIRLDNVPIPQGFPGRKTTVEEVEDEDDVPSAKKKKKSKPKKKKKKTADHGGERETSVLEPIEEDKPATPPRSPTPEPETPAAAPNSSPTAKKNKKKKKTSAPGAPTVPQATLPSPSTTSRASVDSSSTLLASPSTTSLATSERTAQSGRSYIQQQGLDQPKVKVKSRPSHGSVFAAASTDGKRGNFLSRFGKKDEASPVLEDKKERKNWFARLGKKTTTFMHQLMHTSQDETKGQSSMRWEHFVKTMEDMGFTYVPSTAGSSVRFDPSDPSLKSITFHKPHPDPTINQVMLKKISKKLKEYYGWTEEDFLSVAK